MSVRFLSALLAAPFALAGYSTHTPVMLLAGLAGLLPLLSRLVAVPARGRLAFGLTAVAAGLILAAGAHHHPTPGASRPVAMTVSAGVQCGRVVRSR